MTTEERELLLEIGWGVSLLLRSTMNTNIDRKLRCELMGQNRDLLAAIGRLPPRLGADEVDNNG